MQRLISLFALFGGIRPMARELEEHPSTVYTWQRVGRIPSDKQPRVLERGLALGLPITPAHLVYPSGRIPEAVARAVRAQDRSCTASDWNRITPESSAKYGKLRRELHTCDQMVAA